MAAISAAAAAFFLFALSLHPELGEGCCTSIFSFGASVADTGNNLILTGNSCRAGRLPYGETFFHHPTGRFSDGRLIIDFIAQAMGLPLMKPYLGGGGAEEFSHGANFAVAGATALDVDYFLSRGIENLFSNNSLSVQLRWFEQLLPSLCSSASDCAAILSNALFSVGQIGANDYNNPFFQNRTAGEIATFVPDVVSAIGSAIDKLIEMGARTMMVPGSFPMGCCAAYLNKFQGEKQESYDPQTGCINWLNDFAVRHNRLLVKELQRRQRLHPEVSIMYADVYHAAMAIYASPHDYGFEEPVLAPCCGYGPYGDEVSSVCGDPPRRIWWDGLHTTEAANRIIAGGLLGSYTVPPISQVCPDLNKEVVGFDAGNGHMASALCLNRWELVGNMGDDRPRNVKEELLNDCSRRKFDLSSRIYRVS